LGYKAIGNVLGLSRDTVRAYCKSKGMDGDAVTLSRNYEIKKENGILCLNCGKVLKQPKRGKARKFCSEKCRRKWWKENADKGNRKETAVYKVVCAYCGEEFESYGNKNRKYCCHECYIKDRFKKGEQNGI
jgi:endogenous inhibitor of DNA gyrase (YacG/DUF329 family)